MSDMPEHLTDDQLSGVLEGDPQPERHSAECAHCAARVDALRNLIVDLRDVPPPSPDVVNAAVNAGLAAWDQDRVVAISRFRRHRLVPALAGAAAFAILFVGATQFLDSDSTKKFTQVGSAIDGGGGSDTGDSFRQNLDEFTAPEAAETPASGLSTQPIELGEYTDLDVLAADLVNAYPPERAETELPGVDDCEGGENLRFVASVVWRGEPAVAGYDFSAETPVVVLLQDTCDVIASKQLRG